VFEGWIIVIYLGLLMNALGYSIWYYVLGRFPINRILPVMLLLPVTGVLTAIILLGERPNLKVFIGGLIILFGVGVILIDKNVKVNNDI
jgi:O-acetylserine/cysteine efflux transporter